MQRINYRARDRLRNIVNMPECKMTMLIEWYEYNDANTDGRHLTYLKFSSKFVWSPIDVRTISDQVLPTYCARWEALALLSDDKECDIVLKEATNIGSSSKLSLKDLMGMPDVLFGGKMVILGGDFRQTLPIKKGALKFELITSSIAESELCTLCQNMWPLKPGLDKEEQRRSQEFADWLLHVGDGELRKPNEEDADDTCWLDIPAHVCVTPDQKGRDKLIDFIYDEETLKRPTTANLQEKAIVCLKNETTDVINTHILSAVEGDITAYLGNNQDIPRRDTCETEMLYLPEYLNTIKFPRFPLHELQLKVGSPIMLLRNVNLLGVLFNDTRMIVRSLKSKVIEA
nr:DNA helicase [Tanacetum cinerariifolium]